MTIGMENYNNNSSENGQDKTERQSVCRIAMISVLTLDKLKQRAISIKNCNINSDSRQHRPE